LTNDNITIEASEAAIRLGVAVKCATITPNAARKVEYNLKSIWKSPNGTIRRLIGGTCFRKPILINGIEPYIPTWKKPITIARHAYGDIYQNTESQVKSGSKAELVITDPEGKETRSLINSFSSDGIVQGVFNTDSSIRAFADSCFEYALEEKEDLWFATKDTISKTYDRRFRDIFQQEYDNIYKVRFEDNGITYFYTLIDDAVSRAVRSEGGFLWAMKNYDGDVLSDLLATAYGSLGLMTSVLVSPEHVYEYEAAHGTVTRHYYKYLKGEKTSTNPIATIFAWTGALRKKRRKR
jgi:isocitrate dehydrogenase